MISGTFNLQGDRLRVKIYRDTAERVGVAWPAEGRERCLAADIVLVIIGPRWLEARDQYSRRRIDQPDDWVRQEIELALGAGNTVIPIAFGGVDVPPAEALPDSIAELPTRRGAMVRDEFPDDLQPVLREIELHLSSHLAAGRHDLAGAEGRLPYPNPPLVVKPKPLSDEDLETALAALLHGWDVVTSELPEDPAQTRVELPRDFVFPSFLDVLAFMSDVADFADKANHHPRWENIFKTLRVYLTTWDIGPRISPLDIQLAQVFDRTYERQRSHVGQVA